MNVYPGVGEKSSRRWMSLVLGAVVGFVARGEAIAAPAALLGFLLTLFVAVFLITLAFRVLSEQFRSESAAETGGTGRPYPEGQQVSHEAELGSS